VRDKSLHEGFCDKVKKKKGKRVEWALYRRVHSTKKNIIRVQHRCWVKMYRKKRGHHQQLARKNKRI
jgi:hypothetical protein